MDYKELTREINRTFVVKFTDSLGKKKLVGAGQLHKKIGSDGKDVCELMFKKALDEKLENFEYKVPKGSCEKYHLTIRFNIRK